MCTATRFQHVLTHGEHDRQRRHDSVCVKPAVVQLIELYNVEVPPSCQSASWMALCTSVQVERKMNSTCAYVLLEYKGLL